jgi:glutamate 5-kinase
VLGYGMVQYASSKAAELIGQKDQKPLIHYDYLFLKQ